MYKYLYSVWKYIRRLAGIGKQTQMKFSKNYILALLHFFFFGNCSKFREKLKFHFLITVLNLVIYCEHSEPLKPRSHRATTSCDGMRF